MQYNIAFVRGTTDCAQGGALCGLGGGALVPEVGSGIPTGSEKAEAYDSPKTSPSTDFGL